MEVEIWFFNGVYYLVGVIGMKVTQEQELGQGKGVELAIFPRGRRSWAMGERNLLKSDLKYNDESITIEALRC